MFHDTSFSLASFVVFISDVNEESRGSYSRESEIIALLHQTPGSLSDVFLFILAFSKEVFYSRALTAQALDISARSHQVFLLTLQKSICLDLFLPALQCFSSSGKHYVHTSLIMQSSLCSCSPSRFLSWVSKLQSLVQCATPRCVSLNTWFGAKAFDWLFLGFVGQRCPVTIACMLVSVLNHTSGHVHAQVSTISLFCVQF